MDCVSNRTKSLIDASCPARFHDLQLKIREIKSGMNARGALNSSMCVNEVCMACVNELQEFSAELFNTLQRTHKSCGGNHTKTLAQDLSNLFTKHIQDIKNNISGIQQESIGNISNSLQNSSMVQLEWIDEEMERLTAQYKTEITMYADNQHYSSGSNSLERTKNKFYNNKVIVFTIVVLSSIVAISAFTDALSSLSNWALNVVQ